MANDFSLELRKAVVKHLKARAALTALVSANSIYGEQPNATPKWPFIRMGFPTSTPFEATCWDGSAHQFVVHVFAHGPFTDRCEEICKQVIYAMPSLDGGAQDLIDNELVSKQIIRDTDEADAYHGILTYRIALVETV